VMVHCLSARAREEGARRRFRGASRGAAAFLFCLSRRETRPPHILITLIFLQWVSSMTFLSK
jgi:hypothetical protein